MAAEEEGRQEVTDPAGHEGDKGMFHDFDLSRLETQPDMLASIQLECIIGRFMDQTGTETDEPATVINIGTNPAGSQDEVVHSVVVVNKEWEHFCGIMFRHALHLRTVGYHDGDDVEVEGESDV